MSEPAPAAPEPPPDLAARFRQRLAARPRRVIDDPALRPAAVVVPLLPEPDGAAILLTRRTDHVEHHKGEICFPGGRVDPGDADDRAAALREAWEEVGVRPEHLTVLGPLDDFISVTGYRVRPFVALLDRPRYPFVPQPREVEELLLIPAAHLTDPSNHREVAGAVGDLRHRFHWRGQVVWGLTAAILHQFLVTVLQPEPAR